LTLIATCHEIRSNPFHLLFVIVVQVTFVRAWYRPLIVSSGLFTPFFLLNILMRSSLARSRKHAMRLNICCICITPSGYCYSWSNAFRQELLSFKLLTCVTLRNKCSLYVNLQIDNFCWVHHVEILILQTFQIFCVLTLPWKNLYWTICFGTDTDWLFVIVSRTKSRFQCEIVLYAVARFVWNGAGFWFSLGPKWYTSLIDKQPWIHDRIYGILTEQYWEILHSFQLAAAFHIWNLRLFFFVYSKGFYYLGNA
jgi:hypothetical protein